MGGEGGFADRARRSFAWLEEKAHGLSEPLLWLEELLRRAFLLPGDDESLSGEVWRQRIVRELLGLFALCGEDADMSALIPSDDQTLWRWFLSHPSRRRRFLYLLTDPPCDTLGHAAWLKATLATPLRGLPQLMFVTELRDVASVLREGFRPVPSGTGSLKV